MPPSNIYSYYLIWKEQDDRNIQHVREVVGLFHGTREEVDALIEKMNEADPSVRASALGSFNKKWLFGYFQTEPAIITENNWREFIEQ